MQFEILHHTRYDYSAPVSLGVHTIRLHPRCDGSQRLHDFRLDIEPRPVHLAEHLDHEGNLVAVARFEGSTERLRITTHSRIETLRENPFDYLVDPAFLALPPTYPKDLSPAMAHYRTVTTSDADDPVAGLAAELTDQANGNPLVFLDLLARRIHSSVEREIRETGAPLSPRETLSRGRGACRDVAQLFIAASRHAGFAARFVSGYQQGEGSRPKRYLHAWPEVYIPGGGWRGYDPTHGLAVADRHVPVAAAFSPAGAAPIEGGFFGEAASRMETDLTILTR
jgi:transglutaminase-like putative cysteine protease